MVYINHKPKNGYKYIFFYKNKQSMYMWLCILNISNSALPKKMDSTCSLVLAKEV